MAILLSRWQLFGQGGDYVVKVAIVWSRWRLFCLRWPFFLKLAMILRRWRLFGQGGGNCLLKVVIVFLFKVMVILFGKDDDSLCKVTIILTKW